MEKAALTIHELCKLLSDLYFDIVNNRNIANNHFGGKGLHLYVYGKLGLP